jgi:enoyl-CoA hydratase
MDAANRIAEKIASNSPTAVQAVKRALHLGEGQPIEQAIAIMMEAHWRSAVHPDRLEGIGAFNKTVTQPSRIPTTDARPSGSSIAPVRRK